MCEETDEIKESRVAGVKKGEAWRRALNEPEGVGGVESWSAYRHGVPIDHFKYFLFCPECDGKSRKVFQKVNDVIHFILVITALVAK